MSAHEDSKIVRNTSPKTSDAGRESRALADTSRIHEDGTALTLEQRKAILRDNYTNDILPKIIHGQPDMHYCWLSTTNQTDPIYQRLRMGYELVKAEELPDMATQHRIDSGEFEGCISVREMILSKIHVELYRELMLINHHERPLQEEERMERKAILQMEDSEGNQLGKLDDGDTGFASIVKRRPAPDFM